VRRAAVGLLLGGVWLWAPAALAQADGDEVLDPEAQMEAAREAFVAATEAWEAGLFQEALAQFERAYRLTGTPDVLYNIARVADELDRNQKALEAYERYLQLRPEAEDREHVEDRILSLRALLAGQEDPEADPPPHPEPEPVPDPEDRADPQPIPDPEPEPEEGPGPGPWILAGGGLAVAAGGATLFLLADNILGLVGTAVGGAMLVGGVLWAVSF